jgi:cytochrome c biogenesis protein CcmG/thiol:disulfide interchange protein DsbE
MHRLLFLPPVAIFLGVAVFLAVGLTLDPREVPSPLVGKPVPEFRLAPVQGRTAGLATTDLKGEVSLVNVFASWCTSCRDEHPLLMQLREQDTVPVHGLNYKDAPVDSAAWLDQFGDPYVRTGADTDGRAGIEWGVYGVPETFVIDRNGVIAYKHIGPLRVSDLEQNVIPLVRQLTQSSLITEGTREQP